MRVTSNISCKKCNALQKIASLNLNSSSTNIHVHLFSADTIWYFCINIVFTHFPHQFLGIVETAKVHELSQQLERRLCTILLRCWHVQIIYEHYNLCKKLGMITFPVFLLLNYHINNGHFQVELSSKCKHLGPLSPVFIGVCQSFCTQGRDRYITCIMG